MTSPEQGRGPDADGWIAWGGGECPVPHSTIVELKLIGGIQPPPVNAGSWHWMVHGYSDDIRFYRVVESAPAQPRASVEHAGGEVDAEYVKRLEAYALDITRALTGLVGGGSEMFGRKLGEMYTADIEYCVRQIRDRNAAAHERFAKAARGWKEAERALAEARTVTRMGDR